MKKICPLCGTENKEDTRFCKECGEPLYIDSQIEKEEAEIVHRRKKITRARTKDEKLAKREIRKKEFNWFQKIVYIAIGFLLALGLVYIYYTFLWSGPELNNEKPQPTETDMTGLTASVSFMGKQFLITNNDNYDWVDVKIEVNHEFFLDRNRLSAGKTYTIEAAQFAKVDGTRFNLAEDHPNSFRISGKTPSGKYAFWSGRSD